MRKILIVDFFISGHHAEYLDHLVEYLVKGTPKQPQYVFLVHPKFNENFNYIVEKTKRTKGTTWVNIHDDEFRKINQGRLVQRSLRAFRIVDHYAKIHQISHVLLMHFNLFQLALAIRRPSYTVSGILFLQFFRMDRSTLKMRIKYFRKHLLTKLYCLNPRLRKVYILNDEKSASYLNAAFGTNIFEMLADPIPELEPLPGFDVYNEFQIEEGRIILLHLGMLSNRKGTLEFIGSARFLSPQNQPKVALLVVGKAESESMATDIRSEINRLEAISTAQVVWQDSFISSERMKSIFDQCHAVVIPYKTAEASSGILGHAAAANKPVITTGKGLLKEIVETYDLGLLIDDVDPERVAQKIETLLGYSRWKSKSAEFLAERTRESFASKIIKHTETMEEESLTT